MERLMTPPEVADLLQIPVSTLYRWRYERRGPASVRVGRVLRYKPSELQAWIESQADRQGH